MMQAMNIRIKTVSSVILSALGHASVMTATPFCSASSPHDS